MSPEYVAYIVGACIAGILLYKWAVGPEVGESESYQRWCEFNEYDPEDLQVRASYRQLQNERKQRKNCKSA